MTTKVCAQCTKTKSEDEFKIFRGKQRSTCISCDQKNAREVQTRNLREDYPDVEIEGDLKQCGACFEVLSIDDFKSGKSFKDGHASKCGTCTSNKVPMLTKIQRLAKIAEHKAKSKLLETVDGVVGGAKDKVADTVKEESELSDVIGSGKDAVGEVKDVIDQAKDMKEDVEDLIDEGKEAVEELKGFWASIKRLWNSVFKKDKK